MASVQVTATYTFWVNHDDGVSADTLGVLEEQMKSVVDDRLIEAETLVDSYVLPEGMGFKIAEAEWSISTKLVE